MEEIRFLFCQLIIQFKYRVSVLEMDFFRRLEMIEKLNILTCTDDYYVAKGWPFWYLCLLLNKRVNFFSPFSKGGPFESKKLGKFLRFFSNFLLCKSLFWINISYFSINQPKQWIYWGEKWKKYVQFFPIFPPVSKWPKYEKFW